MSLTADWRTHLNRLAVIALALWIAYDAMGTNVFGKRPWPTTMVDYQIIYHFSQAVAETQQYPQLHSHPPAAVALQYSLTRLDFPIAAALHLASNLLAALACWWLLARMTGLHRHPLGGVLVLLAHVASSWFFNWELRSQNCNLHFLLALVLTAWFVHRGRPRAAGFCLALSVAVKLFSVLVVPYLLWTRHYRAAAWSLVFSGLFWGVVPAAVFGPANVAPIYRAWLVQMERNSGDRADLAHPILVSLRNSAHVLSGGVIAREDRLVAGVALAWIALGLIGWRASHLRSRRDAYGLLADMSLLALGPIAVSPYLEPYHALVAAIPLALLLAASVDARRARPWRIFAAALFLASGLCLSLLPVPWPLRGLVLNAVLIFAMTGVIALAGARRSAASERLPLTASDPPRRAA